MESFVFILLGVFSAGGLVIFWVHRFRQFVIESREHDAYYDSAGNPYSLSLWTRLDKDMQQVVNVIECQPFDEPRRLSEILPYLDLEDI